MTSRKGSTFFPTSELRCPNTLCVRYFFRSVPFLILIGSFDSMFNFPLQLNVVVHLGQLLSQPTFLPVRISSQIISWFLSYEIYHESGSVSLVSSFMIAGFHHMRISEFHFRGIHIWNRKRFIHIEISSHRDFRVSTIEPLKRVEVAK